MYGEIGGGVYIQIILRCLDIWVCDRFRRGSGEGTLGISLFLICSVSEPVCVSVSVLLLLYCRFYCRLLLVLLSIPQYVFLLLLLLLFLLLVLIRGSVIMFNFYILFSVLFTLVSINTPTLNKLSINQSINQSRSRSLSLARGRRSCSTPDIFFDFILT